MTGGRDEWARYERLEHPRDLCDWFAEGPMQLRGVRVDEGGLCAARDLRETIQRVAFALLARQPPPAHHVAVLNAFAAGPPLVRALDAETQALVITGPVSVEAVLSELARDALDLVADPRARGRVRQCESPDCQLLFFDDSRPGRRRWCSAARCGDRARARAYRARKAG
jgi:predicted RNA-binding Zn ribbon-like protein